MSEWIAIEDGCVWPEAETIVKVKLHNGFVGLAMFDCNIQDAGDWDLMPLDERGVAGERGSVADQAVAWREATALDRLSGRVTVKADAIAREVYTAMLWAAKHRDAAYLPDWVPGGNSNAQDEARRAESRILAAIDTAPTPSPDQIRRELSPGDMFWDMNNPESGIELWSDPITDHWGGPGEVYELWAAKPLPDIFVTGEVVTVDEHGDPDEVKPVWFHSKEQAEGHFQRSLEAARALITGGDDDAA